MEESCRLFQMYLFVKNNRPDFARLCYYRQLIAKPLAADSYISKPQLQTGYTLSSNSGVY
jgi:hypothetical protein